MPLSILSRQLAAAEVPKVPASQAEALSPARYPAGQVS